MKYEIRRIWPEAIPEWVSENWPGAFDDCFDSPISALA
jgi:hypothetical protein